MDALARDWWVTALRGLLAVAVGLGALLRPATSLPALAPLLGAWWLADGLFAIVAAYRTGEARGRTRPLAVEGVAGMALGLAAYLWPQPSTLVAVLLLTAWFVVTGTLRVVAAARLSEHASEEWLMATSGAVSVLLGALIWLFPGRGAVALVAGFGTLALVAGVMQLALAYRLRGMGRAHRTHGAT